MLPTKIRFTWPIGYRRKEFLKSANQKQESSMADMLLTDWDEMRNEDLP